MVAPTASSNVLRRPNWYARFSVVLGLIALAVGPAAIEASRRTSRITLIEATGAIAASGLLALLAMLLARRGRIYVQKTLGRAGGERLIRTGKLLGVLGVCLGVAAAIALAFYMLLRVFLA